MCLHSNICYNSSSNDMVQWIVQLLKNELVTDWNLHWQGTKTKAAYIGKGGLVCKCTEGCTLKGMYSVG